MSYDWEKIFKNKTNKELYDIVVGRKVLSKEAVNYAKTELEKRNFDFDNMEANRAAWEISSLIEEEDYARLEITGRRAKHISLKILFLIISGTVIIYFIVSKFSDFDFPVELALLIISVSALFILLNNFQAKKQKQAQKKRLERIKELKKKLENENLLTNESSIYNEIKRQRIEEAKAIKTISYIMIGVSAIMILVYILSRIL